MCSRYNYYRELGAIKKNPFIEITDFHTAPQNKESNNPQYTSLSWVERNLSILATSNTSYERVSSSFLGLAI